MAGNTGSFTNKWTRVGFTGMRVAFSPPPSIPCPAFPLGPAGHLSSGAQEWWLPSLGSPFLHLCNGDTLFPSWIAEATLRNAGTVPAWASAKLKPVVIVEVCDNCCSDWWLPPVLTGKGNVGSSLLASPPSSALNPRPQEDVFLRPQGMSQRLPPADSDRKWAGREWPSR